MRRWLTKWESEAEPEAVTDPEAATEPEVRQLSLFEDEDRPGSLWSSFWRAGLFAAATMISGSAMLAGVAAVLQTLSVGNVLMGWALLVIGGCAVCGVVVSAVTLWPRSRIEALTLATLAILFLALFVWPTPYVYWLHERSHVVIRLDRITGAVHYLEPARP